MLWLCSQLLFEEALSGGASPQWVPVTSLEGNLYCLSVSLGLIQMPNVDLQGVRRRTNVNCRLTSRPLLLVCSCSSLHHPFPPEATSAFVPGSLIHAWRHVCMTSCTLVYCVLFQQLHWFINSPPVALIHKLINSCNNSSTIALIHWSTITLIH